MQASRKISASEAISMCRQTLSQISVTGPDDCRRLVAVYDNLGLVQDYLDKQETGGDMNGHTNQGTAGDV